MCGLLEKKLVAWRGTGTEKNEISRENNLVVALAASLCIHGSRFDPTKRVHYINKSQRGPRGQLLE